MKYRKKVCARIVAFMALLLGGWVGGMVAAQTATVAGTTPGQFSVSESGAATYRIPIQVPPGVAGMEPKLELGYNSQGGNGLLGVGWSLSGLSTISRCLRTMAQDGFRGGVNFDMNDRYCIDGQRLILVSGTYGVAGSEYRTELDSFSKIIASGTAGNGVAVFTVQTKAGLTMEYGNTADSRIEAQGKTTVRVWAINKISDVNTNFMTFSYTEDGANGNYYPSRIDYAGNTNAGRAPVNSVQFSVEARPDVKPLYQAGSIVKNTVRLTNVKTFFGSDLLKEYLLQHQNNGGTQRSKLSSLKECDGSGRCLPAVIFNWQLGGSGKVDGGYQSTPATQLGASWLALISDVNGDGIVDVVRVRDSGDIAAWIGRGDGTFSAAYKTTSIDGYAVGGCAGCDWDRLVVDTNADGFADVVRIRDTGDIHVFLGKGDGTFNAAPVVTSATQFGVVWQRMVGDANGDGIPDLIRVRDSGDIVVWMGNGDGSFNPVYKGTDISGYAVGGCAGCDWERMVADVNGDGLADVIRVRDTGDMDVFLGLGDGTFSAVPIGTGASQFGVAWQRMLGDVNGDGIPDLIRIRDSGEVAVWIGRGNGSFDPVYKTTGITGYAVGGCAGCDWERLVADFNGDGLSDVVRIRDTGDIHVFLGTGEGTFAAVPVVTGASQFGTTWRRVLGDVNGDGLLDVVRVRDEGDIASFKQLSLYPDLVAGISGSGAQIAVLNKPLTDSTVYTKDSASNAATYPKVDLQYPQYVVSTVAISNGVGGTVTTQYSYGGLKAEVGTGRGMLGFRWMKSKNLANNIESYTEFNQNWPFTGSVAKSETRLAGSGNAGVLKRSTNTYAQGIGSTTGSTFVYPSQSVEESWDLGGAAYPTVSNAYQYGQSPQYGDPTQISVINDAGAGKTTVNEYWPVNTGSGNWILGRLKKASVTSTAP